MLRFIVRRLLQLIPILLGLSILLFAWLRALPGGPAVAALGERRFGTFYYATTLSSVFEG